MELVCRFRDALCHAPRVQARRGWVRLWVRMPVANVMQTTRMTFKYLHLFGSTIRYVGGTGSSVRPARAGSLFHENPIAFEARKELPTALVLIPA